jgi:metal-responsive CopG/Arc/MetJ family transcriptional regulator
MTVQIALRISDDLAASVDRLCRVETQHGLAPTRSDVLRTAIESYVLQRERELIDEQIVAAYTAIPDTVDDEWGNLAQQQAWLRSKAAQTLDAQDGGW